MNSKQSPVWLWLPAAGAASVGVVTLVGALVDSGALQDFGGAQRTLPVAASAVLIASAALVLRGPAARALALLLMLIGLLGLGEYVLDRQLLPGSARAAANTVACIMLVAASLLSLDRGGRTLRPADAGALLVALIAGLALLGYLFDVPELRSGAGSSPLTQMALPTALAMLALSAGLLSARPGTGLAALVRANGPGGSLLRRLVPAAIVLPVVFGYLRLEGQRAGLYGTAEGLALYCATLVVIFATLLIVTARILERARGAGRARELAIMEATVDAVITLDAKGACTTSTPPRSTCSAAGARTWPAASSLRW